MACATAIYASYRLAKCKSAAQVALEMGNSPAMVFRHYREIVTPADAKKWWNIAPESDGNVIPMPDSKRLRAAKGMASPASVCTS